MLQSTSEYEERSFDDIQRALDIEHTVKALEAQLCYDQHSPEEVARQILKAACKFYDADWCGLIQVDLDLKIWTPFWWYNDSSEDKTTILTEEFESAEFLDRWVQAVRHGKPMIVPDVGAVNELLKQLNTLHSYDLLNQYAARSLAIVPENSRGYYWLIHSLKVQGMDELASNEYQLAKQHLTTEEYKELCTSLGDSCE